MKCSDYIVTSVVRIKMVGVLMKSSSKAEKTSDFVCCVVTMTEVRQFDGE